MAISPFEVGLARATNLPPKKNPRPSGRNRIVCIQRKNKAQKKPEQQKAK